MVIDRRIFRALPYTPEACLEAGIPAEVVSKAIVDGPNAKPEPARKRCSAAGRVAPTLRYVWGSDLLFLMGRTK